jgi:hypothetical protein
VSLWQSTNTALTLSLDVPHDDEKSSWEEDNNFGAIEMETKLEEEEFSPFFSPRNSLTFTSTASSAMNPRPHTESVMAKPSRL